MADTVPTEQAFEQTRGFRWGEVPPTRELRVAALAARVAGAEPDLGGIAGFIGTFRGTGLNTIFRPQDFAVSPTPLPNPATGPDDNILEINLTQETLSFHPALGSIPNRGMVQGDVFLNGIPYLQTIKDVSDPANPVDIHFEPGVWLSVPATTVPEEGATIVRMASIPHGTTIEAQGTSFTVAGGPRINPVNITPFPIGNPGQRINFPSQNRVGHRHLPAAAGPDRLHRRRNHHAGDPGQPQHRPEEARRRPEHHLHDRHRDQHQPGRPAVRRWHG